MTTFYRLKEDGTILDYTFFEDNVNVPTFIREQYTETDRVIIPLVDGGFAFEDEVNLEEEVKRKVEKEFNEAKITKVESLKNMRDTLEVEPIEYNGNLFDYDDKARDRINSAIIALSITGQSIEWTTADNTNVLVTADDLRGIVAAVAVRSNELHVKYRELKELVEVCTTKEEVDYISWE